LTAADAIGSDFGGIIGHVEELLMRVSIAGSFNRTSTATGR
jgi:hypothetical protein